MKLIIAGSRTLFPSVLLIENILLETGVKISELVCGEAEGVDLCGRDFANRRCVPIASFPCTKEDWNTYGKGAGHRRNRQMGNYAEALLLIWDGESSGSKGMKDYMLKLNKPVYEVILKSYNTRTGEL